MPLPPFSPGKHVLIDFYGACNLTDTDRITVALNDAARVCGASVLNINLHAFGDGQGITGVALLAESHISIHTWPEYDYVALDIFMCGECDPSRAIPLLEHVFKPTEKHINIVARGTQLAHQSLPVGQRNAIGNHAKGNQAKGNQAKGNHAIGNQAKGNHAIGKRAIGKRASAHSTSTRSLNPDINDLQG